MQKMILSFLMASVLSLEGCQNVTEYQVTQVVNGPFKVVIRSEEFYGSGIHNIDICVADSAQRDFPEKKAECLLHGYDFSQLSVKWKSRSEIDISFDCGRVSQFSNHAILSPKGSVPVEFHARLFDNCNTQDG